MDTHPKELSLGQDKVCVRDLQLPHGLVVPNVWGDYKEQPVFVSLELTLNPGFQTAASKDVLDQNTIHYGQLAKKVRAASTADQTDTGFRQRLDRILTEMSQRPDGTRRISRSKVDLCLQKGSMYGAVLRITTVTDWDKDVSGWVSQACIRFEAMQVMTLIGVNEYERRRKQPLLVWLDVLMDDGLGVIDPSMSPAVSGLEDVVVQTMEPTAYETLESQANLVIEKLEQAMKDKHVQCSQVKLRIDKPKAIAFAGAASVEVVRHISPVK